MKLPKYEIPTPAPGGFLGAIDFPAVRKYLIEDLKRSGLTPEYMGCREALARSEHYEMQYYIPYFDLEGNLITTPDGMIHMYRLRGQLTSKGRADKRGKYASPSRAQVGELATMPYLHPAMWEQPDKTVVAITEGEKKAASLMLHSGIPCIGIGGKDNWHHAGNQRDLHPIIEAALEKLGAETVIIVPDGDVRKNDIAASFGSLKDTLEAAGYSVRMPLLPDYDDKIDDLIVGRWAGSDIRQQLLELPECENYVQSLQSLVQRYHLQHTVRQRGGVDVPQNDYNVALLISQHPMFHDLWYDEDTQKVKMGDLYINDSEMMHLFATFQYRMSMSNVNQRVFARQLYSVAKLKRARSPWREYLTGVQWDGVPRLETMFIDYCGADDSVLVREVGSKWLPAAVARSFQPGCKVDYMVVTQGAQGIGKSLLPVIIWGQEHVTEILGSPNEKDMLVQMHTGRVASFEEMASFKGNKELNHLKALISGTVDTFRRPYAEAAVDEPRSFVLYGSVNEQHFLMADPSGYRRFPIVPIIKVQEAALKADRDQLWAEAVASYRDGIAYGYIESASAAAADHVVENEEAEAIHSAVCAAAFGGSKVGPGWGFYYSLTGVEMFGFKIRDARLSAGLTGYTTASVKQSLGTLGYQYRNQQTIDGKHYKSIWSVPLAVLK